MPRSRTLKVLAWLLPLTILILLYLRFQPQVQGFIADFTAPYLEAREQVGWRLEQRSAFAKTKVELIREVERLQSQLDNEAFAEQRVQTLEEENAELRRQLQMARGDTYRMVAARVQLRDPAAGGRTYVIDRGARHGLRVGQPVLADGFLAGRVLSVSTHSARVLSITDPNCKVGVRIAGTAHHGILFGRGENRWQAAPHCLVRYLPRDVVYEPDMIVETDEYNELIPAGIPVGEISQVPDVPTVETVDNLYKNVVVRPYVVSDEPSAPFVMVIISESAAVSLLNPAETTP